MFDASSASNKWRLRYVAASLAGLLIAFSNTFWGGGKLSPSYLDIDNGYVITSQLSVSGVYEIGEDSNKDGKYDTWTVATNSVKIHPMQYNLVNINGGSHPDRFFFAVIPEVRSKTNPDPLFSFEEIPKESMDGDFGSRGQIRLNADTTQSKQYIYDDIDMDGRLDVRRVASDKQGTVAYAYYENRWCKILTVEKPYAVIDQAAGNVRVRFEDGAWKREAKVE